MDLTEPWKLPTGDEDKMKALASKGTESKKAVCKSLIRHFLSEEPMTASQMEETVPKRFATLSEKFEELDLDPDVSGRTVREARQELEADDVITKKGERKGATFHPARICACGAPVPRDADTCPVCGWQQEFSCSECGRPIELLDLKRDHHRCPRCREEIEVPTPWTCTRCVMSPPTLAPVQEELADLVGRADPEDADVTSEELTPILRRRQLIDHARRMRELVDDAPVMTDRELVEGVAEFLDDTGFRD